MKESKYTYEIMSALVTESSSVVDILEKRGLVPKGGNHQYISSIITKYGLNTDHFVKGGFSNGNKIAGVKKLPHEILVLDTQGSPRISGSLLRRALLEIGTEYQCEICEATEIWQDKVLTLHVDHINGEYWDNRKENLRFLCPNCHSQTETYGGKLSADAEAKKKARMESKLRRARIRLGLETYTPKYLVDNTCLDCQRTISGKATRCRSCSGLYRDTKITWPPLDELITMVTESSLTAVGRELGVSATAVKKRIRTRSVRE